MAISAIGGLEGLLPIIIPFLIGLVVGLLIKTALKLAIGIVVLAFLLSWGGYVSFSPVKKLFNEASSRLPTLIGGGKDLLNTLPYTAPAFVVGLLIGIWLE